MRPLALNADHGELRRLRTWLESWLHDDDQLAGIELCLHEMASNVIDHAGATGLTINGSVTDDLIEIEIADDGGPYAERQRDEHPRVRGYGHVIAEQLATSIRYERQTDQNRWELRFAVRKQDHTRNDQSVSAATSDTMETSSRASAAETPAMALRMNRKSRSPNVITVSGRLDSIEAAPLRTTINDHLTGGNNRLIVDLSAVEFLDSAGLAALVIGMKRARLEHGDLRLVTPQRKEARRVFELTKFDEVFVMGDTIDHLSADWHDD